MDWIRTKWRSLKRWFIFGVLGTGIALASPVAVTETQIALLPTHEKFVAHKENVIGIEAQRAHASSTVVRYGYIDGTISQMGENEISGLRTKMSQTFDIGDGKNQAVFGAIRYHKVDDVWQDIKFATTTKEAYDLQKKRLIPIVRAQTTDTFTSSDTWTAPAGVTDIEVESWGGGGAGGGSSFSQTGSGGGGGAYSKTNSITVTPSSSYTVTVGTGGNGDGGNGNDGNDSGFDDNSENLAKGGDGGAQDGGSAGSGGLASQGIGNTKYSGGDGSVNNGFGTEDNGGGGGGGAGDSANGGDATDDEAAGGSGGATGGGDGGDGSGGSGGNGGNGSTLGGGGGGADEGSNNGGDGARGEVRITYTAAAPAVKGTPPQIIWFD